MAKNLMLTPEEITLLAKIRIIEDGIKFNRDDRRATIAFTANAWAKMYALVDAFDKEVQWHGTVRRANHNTFVIEDIMIFPHVASPTTVISDQDEYEAWLQSLSDEKFDACRFHGHSHVRMAVTPSGTDLQYRKRIFNTFSDSPLPDEDQFYIFLIVNKKREYSGQIYDLTGNAMYETDEIDIEVRLDDGNSVGAFVNTALDLVKDPPSPPITQSAKTFSGQQTTYPPYLSETDDKWRNRVYGDFDYASDDTTLPYPKTGFQGGTRLK